MKQEIMQWGEWWYLAPQLGLVLGLISLLALGWFVPARFLKWWGVITIFFAFVLYISTSGGGEEFLLQNFQDHFYSEGFLWLSLVVGLSASLFFFSPSAECISTLEWQAAWLSIILGASFMAYASSLPVAYIAFEIVGFSSFLLAGIHLKESAKAGLNYILFGGFSSAIMLFGFSILFPYAGSLQLYDFALVIKDCAEGIHGSLGYLALALISCGLLFKFSMVPFHVWVPQVFEQGSGAGLYLISLLPKITALLLAYALLVEVPLDFKLWGVGSLALISVTLANLAALSVKSPIKMIGFSSIAHAGFIAAMLIVPGKSGMLTAFVYLCLYALGQLAVLIMLEEPGQFFASSFKRFVKAGKRNIFFASLMTLALVSLAGLPPLGGFWAKLLVFLEISSLIKEQALPATILLVGLILNTVLGFGYYLRLPYYLFFVNDSEEIPFEPARTKLAFGLLLVLLLFAVNLIVPFWGLVLNLFY